MIYKVGSLYFREIKQKDIEPLRVMHNDPSTLYMLTDTTYVTKDMQKKWFKSLKKSSKSKRYALCAKEGSQEILLGIIRFDHIDPINHNMLAGLDIMKEQRGKGYGTLGFKLMLDYCFKKLKMHKVALYTAEYNTIALKMYKKLGFEIEGVLREHIHRKDGYHDLICMSLFRK